MKRFKKPKEKSITLKAKDIERMKREITKNTTTDALLIFLVAAKDEMNLSYDDCRQIYLRADRYCMYLDDHLATIKQLAETLKKDTGIDVEWR